MQFSRQHLIPSERLELVSGFGLSSDAAAYVYRPSTLEGVQAVFDVARSSQRSIAFRGAGRSYGDAALNAENIILDMTRMSRILEWNPETGVIRVEAGVTIEMLWKYVLADGWWPPVVPGTMFPTLGGCASMNIHGKNNFRMGPIGEHIIDFEIMMTNAEVLRCSRQQNADLFHAAIGGFGMLGAIVSLTLQMKRIYSGLLDVTAINVGSLQEMVGLYESRMESADYLVGWVDAFASGGALGRGVVHQANYLTPDADPNPVQTLRIEHQELPDAILGLLPKSVLWRLMRPLMNNTGVRLVNAAKFAASRLIDRDGNRFRQSHVGFAFLLDYVPNWRQAYGAGGLIQYQSFIPEATAVDAFGEQLRVARSAGYSPYLAVFKRHRRDAFLMTHSVDGYSLALDFRITPGNRSTIWRMAEQLDRIVLDAGGRFYFAKDSTLQPPSVREYLGESVVAEFRRLKMLHDPEGLLETNLYRRLFGKSAI